LPGGADKLKSKPTRSWESRWARAIEEPLRQIANNAGFEGSVVIEKVKSNKGAFGFNAEKNEYEDSMEAASSTDQGGASGAAKTPLGSRPHADHRGMVAERPEEKPEHPMPAAVEWAAHGRDGRMGGMM